MPHGGGDAPQPGRQDEEETQNKDPVLLTGSRKKPGVCFRKRVQPNLTDPSHTDVLPLPTRTLAVLFPKEQSGKAVGGLFF